ncbi:MAG: RNA polymerase sigma factor, partial [Bacteroidota bacterium]
DIVQDTYERALNRISTFQGKSSLKTWVFAIAANLARNSRKVQSRWVENVTDLGRAAALENPAFLQEMARIAQSHPQGAFEIRDQIAFCFACVSKSLPLPQQIVLLLKEVYAFKIKEIATIIENTEEMVKYYLHQARKKMMDIFDRRCSLINKKGMCEQCSELNGMFNPKQNQQEARMKVEMVRAAETASQEKLLDLRHRIVGENDPFEGNTGALQLLQMSHNESIMEKSK